jgi:hypothetical protein
MHFEVEVSGASFRSFLGSLFINFGGQMSG